MESLANAIHKALKSALTAQGAVAVKGLGTLVLVRQPATLVLNGHKIDPPRAVAAFIPGAVKNDEAVMAHLCALGFSTTESMNLWHDAQSEWQFRLKFGHAVIIPGIGQWQKGLDGTIRFVADGPVQDSLLFGLEPIDAQPVLHEKGKIIRLPEVPVRKALRYAAAAALFIGTASISATQWLNSSSGLSLSVSEMFKQRPVQTYVPRAFDLSVNWADVSTDHETETNGGVMPAPATMFDVACATFATEAEAMAKVNLLTERGFNAKLAGQTNGQFVVSYGTYGSEIEAAGMLASVRITNAEAFIWAH